MRALTCPLVSGQMPPAVRMRCALATRRRNAMISVCSVVLALALVGRWIVIGGSPAWLFRGVRQQTELLDQLIVELVVFGKKRLELRRVEIAYAEQQIAHPVLKLGIGRNLADRRVDA